MNDPVAAISAVSAVASSANAQSLAGMSALREAPMNGTAAAGDVARFQAMVQPPVAGAGDNEIARKLVDAGVGLSHRYADRLDAARQLASISAEDAGIDHTDYMRAMLEVQVSLNEVTMELQSTAQIANSVKDSFNGLYRMQG